jgi:antitoxin (DNA-binding transcriptional repressor) of toxin-antitoxin stability system
LLDRAAKGEPFIIAKAGKPMVKFAPLDTPEAGPVRRLGFMVGLMAVPDDFDQMRGPEIEQLSGGSS